MQTDTFTIEILDHHWINGSKDDPADLCAHGFVLAQIGSEIICEKDTLDVCTSAAASHLLRTLVKDYVPGDFAGQLLPCCGHFMIASDDLKTADVCGCPSGIDWNVMHLPGNSVRLTSLSGTELTITFEDYKTQVLAFADGVKAFYDASSRKILPNDDFDQNGYIAFWNEWHNLRNK